MWLPSGGGKDELQHGLTELTLAAIKPGAKTTVLDVNDNRLEKLPAEIGTLEALERARGSEPRPGPGTADNHVLLQQTRPVDFGT